MKRSLVGLFLAAALTLMMIAIPVPGFSGVLKMSKVPGFFPPGIGVNTGVNANGFQPGGLISDGSFENGPPPASAWTEWSDTPACPTGIVDPQSSGYPPAYDGMYVYWAGGYCEGLVTRSGYVEQEIYVPIHVLALRFQTLFYRPDQDDPDPDVFTVSIDGVPVFSRDMTQANDTFPNWVEQTVDLAPYRDQNVILRIEAASTGDLTGNVLVDFITVDVSTSIPTLNEWGLILLATVVGLLGVFFIRKMNPSC